MGTHMRQGIAVGVFGGAIVGFIVALFSGVLGLSQLDKAPDWLQSWSGTLGVLVSVYAVYLVGQTLKATQDTLKATREMADKQTRAWVMLDEFTFEDDLRHSAWISFKNFGNSPALNVYVHPTMKYYDLPNYKNGSLVSIKPHSLKYDFATAQTLAPNKCIGCAIHFDPTVISSYHMVIELNITYETINSSETQYETSRLRFVGANQDLKLIRM